MQKKTVLSLTAITVSILAMSIFAMADVPQVFAHHRDGHDKGPSGDPPEETPPSIDLITCDDGNIAKWNHDPVTYQNNNKAGLSSSEIDAVRARIED